MNRQNFTKPTVQIPGGDHPFSSSPSGGDFPPPNDDFVFDLSTTTWQQLNSSTRNSAPTFDSATATSSSSSSYRPSRTTPRSSLPLDSSDLDADFASFATKLSPLVYGGDGGGGITSYGPAHPLRGYGISPRNSYDGLWPPPPPSTMNAAQQQQRAASSAAAAAAAAQQQHGRSGLPQQSGGSARPPPHYTSRNPGSIATGAGAGDASAAAFGFPPPLPSPSPLMGGGRGGGGGESYYAYNAADANYLQQLLAPTPTLAAGNPTSMFEGGGGSGGGGFQRSAPPPLSTTGISLYARSSPTFASLGETPSFNGADFSSFWGSAAASPLGDAAALQQQQQYQQYLGDGGGEGMALDAGDFMAAQMYPPPTNISSLGGGGRGRGGGGGGLLGVATGDLAQDSMMGEYDDHALRPLSAKGKALFFNQNYGAATAQVEQRGRSGGQGGRQQSGGGGAGKQQQQQQQQKTTMPTMQQQSSSGAAKKKSSGAPSSSFPSSSAPSRASSFGTRGSSAGSASSTGGEHADQRGGAPLQSRSSLLVAASEAAKIAKNQYPGSPYLTEERRCRCKKSKCLKLYCECFAAHLYCTSGACGCVECNNLPGYEAIRVSAIEGALSRNPEAFANKVTKAEKRAAMTTSNGCNCRKSLCLKKYCECFFTNMVCTSDCKCEGCENYKGSRALSDKRLQLQAEDEQQSLALRLGPLAAQSARAQGASLEELRKMVADSEKSTGLRGIAPSSGGNPGGGGATTPATSTARKVASQGGGGVRGMDTDFSERMGRMGVGGDYGGLAPMSLDGGAGAYQPPSTTNAKSPTKKKNRLFSPTDAGKVFSFD